MRDILGTVTGSSLDSINVFCLTIRTKDVKSDDVMLLLKLKTEGTEKQLCISTSCKYPVLSNQHSLCRQVK